ncbi:hypothetical protein DPX16_20735 [Anabarilius grahami]|uniref:Uncharacterized protein n=1 Tax=Anabarilius grahami TaxID=495550 RepID=A0A3N0YE00_ANAGA|nr:hypothetical protein DPX16_20735 [Anabarilius grahami]
MQVKFVADDSLVTDTCLVFPGIVDGRQTWSRRDTETLTADEENTRDLGERWRQGSHNVPYLTVGFSRYRVDLVYLQRAPEMKFPADPESRRALTGRQKSAAVRFTTIVSGFILFNVGMMTLTIGRTG